MGFEITLEFAHSKSISGIEIKICITNIRFLTFKCPILDFLDFRFPNLVILS